MSDPQFYPQHQQQPPLIPLRIGSLEYDKAWRDYQAAAAHAWTKGPLTTNQHILWLLVTVFTFGLGGIGWIFAAVSGNRVVRPGAYAPPWPPPGYYVEYRKKGRR